MWADTATVFVASSHEAQPCIFGKHMNTVCCTVLNTVQVLVYVMKPDEALPATVQITQGPAHLQRVLHSWSSWDSSHHSATATLLPFSMVPTPMAQASATSALPLSMAPASAAPTPTDPTPPPLAALLTGALSSFHPATAHQLLLLAVHASLLESGFVPLEGPPLRPSGQARYCYPLHPAAPISASAPSSSAVAPLALAPSPPPGPLLVVRALPMGRFLVLHAACSLPHTIPAEEAAAGGAGGGCGGAAGGGAEVQGTQSQGVCTLTLDGETEVDLRAVQQGMPLAAGKQEGKLSVFGSFG